MNSTLDGKFAIVTGGGTGIGLGCADALLGDGATVTIVGRRPEVLQQAAAARGERCRWAVADVSNEEDVRSAVEAAASDGCLDIAVLGAGVGSVAPVASDTHDSWRKVFETNVFGAFLAMKHVIPMMTKRGSGSIVAISSIAATLAHRYMSAYGASKAAVDALVRNAADELGSSGIRVNSVRPGFVPTDMTQAFEQIDGIRNDFLDQIPLGRAGSTQDVAATVRFLAGPESCWMTGQHLTIDGGHTLRRGPNITPLAQLIYRDAWPAAITADARPTPRSSP